MWALEYQYISRNNISIWSYEQLFITKERNENKQ